MTITHVDHPAKYSTEIMELLQELLANTPGPILDGNAGTGRIHDLGRDDTAGVEIEPEWAALHERTVQGDCLDLPFAAESFGTYCTSVTYGNRFADQYLGPKCADCGGDGWNFNHKLRREECASCDGIGRNGKGRHSYAISLGRKVSEGSSAGMQWGTEYQTFHEAMYLEAWRVIRPGGRFILNVSDHVRKNALVEVTEWHVAALASTGFILRDSHQVDTPRMGYGRNSEARAPHESVIVFDKPDDEADR